MKYQDDYWSLYFTGMKSTISWDEVNQIWVYEMSGLGVGSYGPNSRFGNAFVRGTIYFVSEEYTDWYSVELNFDVTYYA